MQSVRRRCGLKLWTLLTSQAVAVLGVSVEVATNASVVRTVECRARHVGFARLHIFVASSPWVVRYTGSSRKASHLLLKTVR